LRRAKYFAYRTYRDVPNAKWKSAKEVLEIRLRNRTDTMNFPRRRPANCRDGLGESLLFAGVRPGLKIETEFRSFNAEKISAIIFRQQLACDFGLLPGVHHSPRPENHRSNQANFKI